MHVIIIIIKYYIHIKVHLLCNVSDDWLISCIVVCM